MKKVIETGNAGQMFGFQTIVPAKRPKFRRGGVLYVNGVKYKITSYSFEGNGVGAVRRVSVNMVKALQAKA